ncbi:MAG: ribonuclease R [Minisyncoccia bacterium]
MTKKQMTKQHYKHGPKKEEKKHAKFVSILSVNMRGIGYVKNPLNDKKDAEISTHDLNTGLPGDEVEVILHPKRKGNDTQTAEVLKIVKRAHTEFVGTLELEKNGQFLFFIPDNKKIYSDFYIYPSTHIKAEAGDKALVKLIRWDNPDKNPEGEIVQILGKKGDNTAEMHSIVAGKGFDIDFPARVEAEANEISKKEKNALATEIATRRDMRQTLTFTIDPATAKDFDDAISFKTLSNGQFEIGVHIADVSHYVREHSELDKEAFKRQFSVYLVDRTIPMLPHVLSDDLCSLNEKEDKLSFSAIFEMDGKGQISKRWFGKTIMNSAKRFAYEEAQATIDNPAAKYHKELKSLNDIAKHLRAEKEKQGAIDFEQDEISFELDDKGVPIRIFRKSRLDAHKLVEEYMLLANREVAEYIWKSNEKREQEFPFLYRTHDLPNQEKIENLAIFVKALGFELKIGKDNKISPKDLQALINSVAGEAEEGIIKTAAVRSMAKAIYSTANIGHFGLAFDYYTHFTSPIRRYPDLLVHRMLQKVLTNKPISKDEWNHYAKTADRATEKEISAAEAERESKKYKQVEYMQKNVGQTFDGVISGVTDWGIYVEELATRSEGLVKVRSLGDDFFELDQKNYCLVGQKTKKRFRLGDKVKIKLIGTDLERKTMDFELAQ